MGSNKRIICHSKKNMAKQVITVSTFAELPKGNQHNNINLKIKTLKSSHSPVRLKLFHFKNQVTNVSKMHKLLDIPPLPRSSSIGFPTEPCFHTD